MIKRRSFLLGGLGVIVVAGLSVIGIGPVAARSEVASLVRKRLNFLKLEEAGLQEFAKDQVAALLAKRPTWNRWKYHFLVIFTKQFSQYGGYSNDKRTRTQRLADNLSTLFLLSSDFFVNGADESRTIQYTGLYDSLVPCSSPFARPAITPPAAS
ncbi:MAG: hypothetical protein ACJ8R9_22505 [Steroidobacteraceae bacterium]